MEMGLLAKSARKSAWSTRARIGGYQRTDRFLPMRGSAVAQATTMLQRRHELVRPDWRSRVETGSLRDRPTTALQCGWRSVTPLPFVSTGRAGNLTSIC
jgi:hypothetical protein